MQVDITEVQNRLPELMENLLAESEDEIIIVRDDKPIIRMIRYIEKSPRQLGRAKGLFSIPDNLDECNDKIETLFGVS